MSSGNSSSPKNPMDEDSSSHERLEQYHIPSGDVAVTKPLSQSRQDVFR